MSKLSIRPLTEKDLNFILSSWVNCSYEIMAGFKPRRADYYKNHQVLVKEALREDATLVACPQDDEDLIVGWINFGSDYLNFIFIKQTFEHLGVASALLTQAGFVDNKITVTHLTGPFIQRFSTKYKINYNPYLFFNREKFNENQDS
jgi:hypothetical protein